MTKLILLRHGEAEGNIGRRFHGFYNSSLTENGRKQVELAALALQKEPIDIIYSSDLKRALDTARAAAKFHPVKLIENQNLREINGGDWENLFWEELPEKYPKSYSHWLDFPHLLQMPNGESMQEFQKRVVGAIRGIVEGNAGKTILVVTHGTAIKVFLCWCYGLELSEFPSLPWCDNASISVIEIDDDMRYNVVKCGENVHLGELSTLNKQDWWKNKE